ncbi:Lcl C-terminal domain-containing protein [Methylotuvimicrobium alcaliphilum]|uniref:Lipoprotein n=1 Tax=Methylotuvimicrobium alcaliphilum (strain DSM 19304 / NCIMB 14124 / VKM B-2133 / 20Z) TaxID=1091494 RepID=G4T483_META2
MEKAKTQTRQQGLIAGRYRDNGDGTLTDIAMGLQWMRCSLGQIWQNGTCMGEAKRYTFNDALNAGQQIVFAGYRDWREPTIFELKTLIYCSSDSPKMWNDTKSSCSGNYQRSTIHRTAFPNTPASVFWSSSPTSLSYAWYVDFYYGYFQSDARKTSGYHVRLVRSGQ